MGAGDAERHVKHGSSEAGDEDARSWVGVRCETAAAHGLDVESTEYDEIGPRGSLTAVTHFQIFLGSECEMRMVTPSIALPTLP